MSYTEDTIDSVCIEIVPDSDTIDDTYYDVNEQCISKLYIQKPEDGHFTLNLNSSITILKGNYGIDDSSDVLTESLILHILNKSNADAAINISDARFDRISVDISAYQYINILHSIIDNHRILANHYLSGKTIYIANSQIYGDSLIINYNQNRSDHIIFASSQIEIFGISNLMSKNVSFMHTATSLYKMEMNHSGENTIVRIHFFKSDEYLVLRTSLKQDITFHKDSYPTYYKSQYFNIDAKNMLIMGSRLDVENMFIKPSIDNKNNKSGNMKILLDSLVEKVSLDYKRTYHYKYKKYYHDIMHHLSKDLISAAMSHFWKSDNFHNIKEEFKKNAVGLDKYKYTFITKAHNAELNVRRMYSDDSAEKVNLINRVPIQMFQSDGVITTLLYHELKDTMYFENDTWHNKNMYDSIQWIGSSESPIDPEELDNSYYIGTHQYLRDSIIDPFYHYIASKESGDIDRHYAVKEAKEILNNHFDESFYREKYSDIKRAYSKNKNFDCIKHYHIHGFREGRDPSNIFSTKDYLDAHPEVKRSGINPLIHYVENLVQDSKEDKMPLGKVKKGKNAITSIPNSVSFFSKYDGSIIESSAKVPDEIKSHLDELIVSVLNDKQEESVESNEEINQYGNRAHCNGQGSSSYITQREVNFYYKLSEKKHSYVTDNSGETSMGCTKGIKYMLKKLEYQGSNTLLFASPDMEGQIISRMPFLDSNLGSEDDSNSLGRCKILSHLIDNGIKYGREFNLKIGQAPSKNILDNIGEDFAWPVETTFPLFNEKKDVLELFVYVHKKQYDLSIANIDNIDIKFDRVLNNGIIKTRGGRLAIGSLENYGRIFNHENDLIIDTDDILMNPITRIHRYSSMLQAKIISNPEMVSENSMIFLNILSGNKDGVTDSDGRALQNTGSQIAISAGKLKNIQIHCSRNLSILPSKIFEMRVGKRRRHIIT